MDRHAIETSIKQHLTEDGRENFSGFGYHTPGTITVMLDPSLYPFTPEDIFTEEYLEHFTVEADVLGKEAVDTGLGTSRPGMKTVTHMIVHIHMTPETFRRYRRILDLTQAELAASLGCSESYIQKMEGGHSDIRPVYALAMERLLSLAGVEVA